MLDETTMEAGRELDALIAETVMGWPSLSIGQMEPLAGFFPDLCGVRRENGAGNYDIQPFHPSTDIAAAWQVVEHMRTHAPVRYRNLSLVAYCYNRTYASFDAEAIGGAGDDAAWSEANGEHATPLAICRAALLAVGGPP